MQDKCRWSSTQFVRTRFLLFLPSQFSDSRKIKGWSYLHPLHGDDSIIVSFNWSMIFITYLEAWLFEARAPRDFPKFERCPTKSTGISVPLYNVFILAKMLFRLLLAAFICRRSLVPTVRCGGFCQLPWTWWTQLQLWMILREKGSQRQRWEQNSSYSGRVRKGRRQITRGWLMLYWW